jgi:nucleotide-binding universal stress UspA family protein
MVLTGKEQTMFEKILVPLDTSPFAEEVLPTVIELARSFDSEIHLVNICEAHKGPDAGVCQSYLEDKVEQINKGLEGKTNKIKADMLTGSPGQKILSLAKEEKAGLIVMSSHGLSGVTLWPLGSTVDKVLRQTRQPLLIIKVKQVQETASQGGVFRRILVPLDGSELGARVVPFIVGIASRFGSEVVLFHVIQTDKRLHSLGRIDSVPIREEEMSSLRKQAEEYLKGESRKFEGSGAAVVSLVKAGNVAEEIIKYAAEINCHLIALSSHGHSGLESWIIGSVTNKILHAGNKSLFFVPAIEA